MCSDLSEEDVRRIVREELGRMTLSPAAQIGPRVLNTKDAARYCAMGVQTLYNLISQGQGPEHHKDGSRNVFYPADLDAWIASRLRGV